MQQRTNDQLLWTDSMDLVAYLMYKDYEVIDIRCKEEKQHLVEFGFNDSKEIRSEFISFAQKKTFVEPLGYISLYRSVFDMIRDFRERNRDSIYAEIESEE